MREATEEERFNALYQKYEKRLRVRIAFLARERDEVEEIAQQTWIRVARAFPHIEEEPCFGWLYRIATNVFYDWWRAQKREQKYIAFSLDELPEDADEDGRYQAGDIMSQRELLEEESLLSLLIHRETMSHVYQTLAALPSALQRQAVYSLVTGETPRKLAERLDVPKGSVYSARRCGLAYIRRRIA